MMEHKISIIGMGYVGLCTAVFLSIKGYKIITTELDPKKVELINRGIPPFYEPDLKEYLQKVVKNGFLKCIINNRDAILDTDITFITVGTPRNPDGSINLQYIEDVAHEIGEALRDKET
ncbi:MAG: UDP-glucose 6-dehydrogenase, partial [Candidatus Hodarchaeota archaeon]